MSMQSGKVSPANVPPGLTLRVVAIDSQHATLSFSGNAATHTTADNIANLAVTFLDSAFVGGIASSVNGASRSDLTVTFLDPPVLTVNGTTFAEAVANNGTIGNSNTITLAGDTFVAGTYVTGVQFTAANVPLGLSLAVTASGGQAVVSLTGTASAHAAANSVTNLSLTFLDAAFTTVAAANIVGQPIVYAVTFADPAALTYSRMTFTEISAGYIDNRNPLTITLAGDLFGGADGNEFVGNGWATVTNLPAGLTATLTRDSATQISMRLNGVAAANAPSNSASNVGVTFLAGAFAHAAANLVAGNPMTGISVTFIDDTGFFNVIPFEEPFEAYANGTTLIATNGWTSDYLLEAGTVTNDPVANASLTAYLQRHASLPITGPHTQVLCVQDALRNEIHGPTGSVAYLDFMTVPVAPQYTVDSDTNLQYGFYVSTNQQLVIWHCNTTGGSPTNQWLALTNAGPISTSQWVRFTVAQDYANHRFQMRVNEGSPVMDAAGWDDTGTTRPGAWFYMVQTNAAMSRFWISGGGLGYLDDLTVKAALPGMFGQGVGTIFKFR